MRNTKRGMSIEAVYTFLLHYHLELILQRGLYMRAEMFGMERGDVCALRTNEAREMGQATR